MIRIIKFAVQLLSTIVMWLIRKVLNVIIVLIIVAVVIAYGFWYVSGIV